MLLPSQLICSDGNIRLIRLVAADIDWVIDNTDPKLLEIVFSSHGNESLREFYETQFSWTYVYLITNSNNESFGMIRVVPEMDNLFSLHGIGWPNKHHFSRIYFKAWIGLHQYLFNSQDLIRSNCRDDNFSAINVLVKTGYEASFLNVYLKGERNLNFILSSKKFKDSSLYMFNRGISFSKEEPNINRSFKPIKIHSAKKEYVINNLQLNYIKEYHFKSNYIQNRKDIQLPKKLIRLSLNGLCFSALILHFEHFRQIHLEPSTELSFLKIMQFKSEWRNRLKFYKNDLIFTYFESSSKHLVKQLMLGDFIYHGDDKHRSCMIWSAI